MSVLICELPSALDGGPPHLAKRHGLPQPVLVRETIGAKIAENTAVPRCPTSLIDAVSGKVPKDILA